MKSFTLIETLIAIVIFTLMIGALSGFIVYSYKVHALAWQQSIAIEEARRGVSTMVKEIREATSGEDGSYPIEKAGNKEFIFYSDIDKDGAIERVRYFLGGSKSGNQIKECYSFFKGGSCDVDFSDFLQGNLTSAELKVSIEGDLGWKKEYVEIYADGDYLGKLCREECSDCAGVWQGNSVFDVTNEALDGFLHLSADSNFWVDPFCSWGEANHSIRVRFELSWQEEVPGLDCEFKKGIINPTSFPAEYPLDQEEISILSSYVRNTPPIFEYFDGQGNKITEYPARLVDTKLMKVFLVIDVDPNRLPKEFELESYVKLRNLKEE